MSDIHSYFTNKKRLQQALTLAHHGKSAPYERLEFLGDRVVGLVIADLLEEIFPRETEGALAKRFVTLVRMETLADVARQLNLSEHLITQETELRHNDSILADVMEAVLGALYLEAGLETVKSFMRPLWLPLIKAEHVVPQDPKTELQEWCQKKYHCLPVYQFIERRGPDHQPIFTVEARAGKMTVKAEGSSKKQAEQKAAALILQEVKK